MSKKRYCAILMAAAMIMGISTNAFATTNETPTVATPSITKKLEMAEGLSVPDATFSFTIEKVTPDAPDLNIAPVVYSLNDQKGNPENGKYTISKKSDLQFGEFPHAGEFAYRITETPGNVPTVTYSTESYYLRVQVANPDQGNLYIKAITAEKGSEIGDKQKKVGEIVFTNTYRKSASLSIEKKTEGTLADKTKFFEFEIIFTKSPTELQDNPTYIGKITTNKEEKEIPVTVGTPAKFSLKDGDKLVFDDLPAGTKYVVTEMAAEDGYTPKIQVTDNDVTGQWDVGTEKEGLSSNEHYIGEKNNAVTFINTYNDVPVTGIIMNNLPFILLIVVAILAFGTLAFLKKRKNSGK
ncbi:DUF7601 domain-containing protein [Parablautia sp. Marseille-Q6255]|uniref:DUF7601 domain-containing protein n=1 Tax=Parablautia sp. Marseille-Q6255 TaxID=3039593 RepID=UPI0024BC8093|nr:FctA domain-containing protein [Parablautia sp. Marseille-Q6255]